MCLAAWVAVAAVRMWPATAAGCDNVIACEASTSTVSAPARRAMKRCAAGWIAWSAVATTYQDGRLFQLAAGELSSNATAAMGRCATAATEVRRSGKSAPNTAGNWSSLRYSSTASSPLPVRKTAGRSAGPSRLSGNRPVMSSTLSPASKAKAVT